MANANNGVIKCPIVLEQKQQQPILEQKQPKRKNNNQTFLDEMNNAIDFIKLIKEQGNKISLSDFIQKRDSYTDYLVRAWMNLYFKVITVDKQNPVELETLRILIVNFYQMALIQDGNIILFHHQHFKFEYMKMIDWTLRLIDCSDVDVFVVLLGKINTFVNQYHQTVLNSINNNIFGKMDFKNSQDLLKIQDEFRECLINVMNLMKNHKRNGFDYLACKNFFINMVTNMDFIGNRHYMYTFIAEWFYDIIH